MGGSEAQVATAGRRKGLRDMRLLIPSTRGNEQGP